MLDGLYYNGDVFFDIVNALKTLAKLRENHQPIIAAVLSCFLLGEHVVGNFDDRCYNPSLPNYSHDSH